MCLLYCLMVCFVLPLVPIVRFWLCSLFLFLFLFVPVPFLSSFLFLISLIYHKLSVFLPARWMGQGFVLSPHPNTPTEIGTRFLFITRRILYLTTSLHLHLRFTAFLASSLCWPPLAPVIRSLSLRSPLSLSLSLSLTSLRLPLSVPFCIGCV